MSTALCRAPHLAFAAGLAAVLLLPLAVSAQSQLDADQAGAFMGDWDMPLQTEYGPFDLELKIEDQGGKVAASVGSVDLGGMQSVTDIRRSGDDLVLAYDADAQGQIIPVVLTLTRDGEDLSFSLDAAGGMFMVSGVATRASS